MIIVDVPGHGRVAIEHVVSDFSGTLSEDGHLIQGVKERLNELAGKVHLHILTSDTFGRARKELMGIACTVHILEGTDHTEQKEKYVLSLGAEKVASLGNGNNDVLMLKASAIGIAVCLKEGCSTEALNASRILVRSPLDAIGLLLEEKRLIATLRR